MQGIEQYLELMTSHLPTSDFRSKYGFAMANDVYLTSS
jgi:hypothetical protein